jgi:hypothetical protein
MPLIHKPSFMSDLEAGEEERNPIFFALILQMISMTLIHVSHPEANPMTDYTDDLASGGVLPHTCGRRASGVG